MSDQVNHAYGDGSVLRGAMQLGGAALALALGCPGTVLAETLTFPGPPPCDQTLSSCVLEANSGDVVEIATDDSIVENVFISKSLVLRSAAGFMPVLGAPGTPGIVSVSASNDRIEVVIEGLTLNEGRILASANSGDGHSITIRNNTILFESGNNNTPAIDLNLNVPMSAVVQSNSVTTTGQGFDLRSEVETGVLDLTVERNYFTTTVPEDSGSGVRLDLSGSGTYSIQVFSNVIYGVNGCNCGAESGISVRGSGGPQVTLSVANNTIHDIAFANGFRLLGIDPPATMTLNLFNNIVSSAPTAFRFSNVDGGNFTLNADSNNVFDTTFPSDFGGQSAGTVLNVEPMFFDGDTGDLRMLGSSPLIDAGVTAPTGGVSVLDAAGIDRVFGAQVDLGAYEYASVPALFFTLREDFEQHTNAATASASYAPVNRPSEPFESGDISFDAFTPSTLNFSNWPADFANDNDVELALNGDENLAITSTVGPVYAMGIDFDDLSGGSTPSTFNVIMLNDSTEVGRARFQTPDANQDFVGVWSPDPFDELQILESTAENENEYFGAVLTGRERLGDTLIFLTGFE